MSAILFRAPHKRYQAGDDISRWLIKRSRNKIYGAYVWYIMPPVSQIHHPLRQYSTGARALAVFNKGGED